MSAIVEAAVAALNAKLAGQDFDGSVRVIIEDAGALTIGEGGAVAGDGPADCTLTADAETFQGMLEGEVNPTAAFMSGRLKIDGDMGLAMKLGSLLG